MQGVGTASKVGEKHRHPDLVKAMLQWSLDNGGKPRMILFGEEWVGKGECEASRLGSLESASCVQLRLQVVSSE